MKVLNHIDMEANRIEDMANPVSAQDAATKAYVDSVGLGIDAKQSVRVVSTGAVTLASAFENTDSIDGVALATGNRILIAGQAAPGENGIYTVNASGAPTRATDADAVGDISGGSYVFVEEGTAYSDSGWVCTTNGNVTPGSTQNWTQFTGAGALVAGSGLTKTGSQIDVGAGDGITVATDTVLVDSTVARRNATNTFTLPQTIDLGGAGTAQTLDVNASGEKWLNFTTGGAARGSISDSVSQLVIDAASVMILQTAASQPLVLQPGGNIQINSSKKITGLGDATLGTDALNRNSADARYVQPAAANTFTLPQTIDLAATGTPLTVDIHDAGAKWIDFTETGSARGSISELLDGIYIQAQVGSLNLATGLNGNVNLSPAGTGVTQANSKRITNVGDATTAVDAMNQQSSDARYPRKYSAAIGDGVSTTLNVNHALNTRDLQVTVYRNSSPYDEVQCDIEHTDANNAALKFAVIPALTAYRVVINSG